MSEELPSGSGETSVLPAKRGSITLTLTVTMKKQGFVVGTERKPREDMADTAVLQPKSMVRPKVWDEEVEEAYRFQLAGYRDAIEYKQIQKTEHIDRWPHNGYVKKLVRRDGYFYYYNKTRECPDKDINKTKMYSY